jgi:hypothetical protein
VRRDRARWLRFGLKLAALWATLLGAGAYAVTGDIDALWWGLRLTGGVAVCSGLLGVARHYRERRGETTARAWTPSRALTGVVRICLGGAVVLATL